MFTNMEMRKTVCFDTRETAIDKDNLRVSTTLLCNFRSTRTRKAGMCRKYQNKFFGFPKILAGTGRVNLTNQKSPWLLARL
jgi:hypothetical protein